MAHFFGRFFKKTPRKGTPSPAYFEALESRQLLSATFSSTNLVATDWYYVSATGTGTIAIDGAGLATGTVGSHTLNGLDVGDTDQTTVAITGSGGVTFTSAEGLGTLTGSISSNQKVISLNDNNGGNDAYMIKRDGTVNKAELAGTWSFSDGNSFITVTLAVDSKTGALKIGNLSVVTDGQAVKIDKAGSAVTIAGDGLSFSLSVKPASGSAEVYTGYLGASGDVAIVTNADGDPSVAIKSATAKTFTSADLASDWYTSGANAAGSMTVGTANSKGVSTVTGTLVVSAGVNSAVTSTVDGSLKLNADGTITGTLTLNKGTLLANTITVTGRMNLTKNIIELHSADGSLAVSLTTSADHAAVFANAATTQSITGKTEVYGNTGVNLSYAEVLAKLSVSDIDGDDAPTSLSITVKAGVLVVNGSDYHVGDSVTVAASGLTSTFTWYASSDVSTSKVVAALLVKADLADAASTGVNIGFKRVANPTEIKSTTKNPTAGTTDANLTVSRTDTTGAETFKFDVSGAATDTTDYTIALATADASKGTVSYDSVNKILSVTLNAGIGSVTLVVHNMAVASTGDKLITLALQQPSDYDAGYELGKSNAVTVNIAGTHSASAVEVSISGPKSIAEGKSGEFTISAAKAVTTAQNIDFKVNGITGRYTLQYYNETSKTWQTLNQTNDAGTVTIAAGKKSVKVRVNLTENSVVNGDVSASLAITIPAGSVSAFYANSDSNSVSFVAQDNEPVLSATTKNANEKGEAAGTFTIKSTVAPTSSNGLNITFALAGTAIYGTDYTVAIKNAQGVITAITPTLGKFTVNLPKGATSVAVYILPKADNNFAEASETVVLELDDSANTYSIPSTDPSLSIINNPTNSAPTITSGTVTGEQFTVNAASSTTAKQTVTLAQLKTLLKVDDNEDGTSVNLVLTALESNVSIALASAPGVALTANAVITGDIIVTIANGFTAGNGKTLFSVKAVDTQNLSSKAVAVKGNVIANATNAAPTFGTNVTQNTSPSSSPITITYAQVVTATGASDANGDALTFTISGIGANLVYKNGSSTALVDGDTITVGDELTWTPGVASGTVTLFNVSVKDALHATSSTTAAVKFTVANVAPTITNTTVDLGTIAPSTAKTLTYTDLKTAIGATDANNDDLTFTVTNVAGSGLKLTDVNGVALAVDATVTVGGAIYWTGVATAGVTQLFTVSTKDATHAAVGTSVFSITVSDVAPSLSQKPGNPDVSIGGTGTFTLDASNFATYLDSTDANGDTITYTITAIDTGTLTIGAAPWDATNNATFTLDSLATSPVVWTKAGGATVANDVLAFTLTATSTTHTASAITFEVDLIA